MTNYVFYDDTDCGGIVYHTQYLVFCERARSLLFFQNNMLPQENYNGFVVKKIESNFIASLQLGDQYQVKTALIAIKNASIVLQQEIFRIAEIGNNSDSMLSFNMVIQLAYVNMQNKKAEKIPDSLKATLQRIFQYH